MCPSHDRVSHCGHMRSKRMLHLVSFCNMLEKYRNETKYEEIQTLRDASMKSDLKKRHIFFDDHLLHRLSVLEKAKSCELVHRVIFKLHDTL